MHGLILGIIALYFLNKRMINKNRHRIFEFYVDLCEKIVQTQDLIFHLCKKYDKAQKC